MLYYTIYERIPNKPQRVCKQFEQISTKKTRKLPEH